MTPHEHPVASIRPVFQSLGRRRVASAFGLLVAALVFTACAGSGGASSSSMSLEVTTPSNGAAVGRSFPVAVRANVPFGKPSTGRHHLHLYFDGNKNEGEYDIVYGKHTTVTELTPGRHTVEAEIANPDHSGTGVTREFSVTVGAKGADTPSTRTPPTTGRPPTSTPDYGY